jgi:hypothetical protein
MKKQIYTLAVLLITGFTAQAQVGIGTPTPSPSSMLDITSTTKGLLMPRMTTGQRTAIPSPATGLQVYDTTTNSFWYFNGTIWVNTGANTQDLRYLGSNNHVTQDGGIGSNGTSVGTGTNVIGIGAGTLSANTTGSINLGIGTSTLTANTIGAGNTGIGTQALTANTTGGFNTALGYVSLQNNTTGSNNVAVGVQAGNNITTGSGNIAIGNGTPIVLPTGNNQLNIANTIYGTGLTGGGAGFIGIGTSAPNTKLHVAADQTNFNNELAQLIVSGTDTSKKLLLGYNTTSDNGYIQSVHSGLNWTNLILQPNAGNVGMGTATANHKLTFDSGYANAAKIALVEFGATNSMGLGVAAGQFRLNIGSTSDKFSFLSSETATTDIMTLKGNGELIVTNTITAPKIQGPSDFRFKKNIKPIENALDKVLKLGGYTYDWKDTSEFPGQTLGKGHDMGVIAQEVEKQFPEAVTTNADGYKAVSYTELVPALIEAIKTQQAQIDELKQQLSRLQK